MRKRSVFVYLVAIGLAAAATAQTKTSGTLQCSKPDPMHAIEAGDKPGHAFAVSKTACTWTKPMDLGGAQTKDGGSVSSLEIWGAKSSGGGTHWSTMSSGDKIFVHFQGKATSDKDGNIESAEGTWSYTGGTGKLKGIKGKGTYKGKGGADGSVTYEVEGEYKLP